MNFIQWCQNNRAFDTFFKSHLSHVDLWVLRLVCKGLNAIIPKQPDKTVNIITAAREGHLGGLKTLCKDRFPKSSCRLCIEVSRSGSLEILNWMDQEYFCMDEYAIFHTAIEEGQLKVLEWCYNNLPRIKSHSSAPCNFAARHGQLNVLKWLKDKNYNFGNSVCEAAENGHLEVLQWLRQQGCDWSDTCFYAAKGGHLHVLKWARENGCPWMEWGSYICANLIRRGNLELLKWVVENGCPYEERSVRVTDEIRDSEIVKWCVENVPKIIFY